MTSESLGSIIDALEELNEDTTVPKNIKIKLEKIFNILKENNETSIKLNKALHLLDEISDDPNINSFTRTQIWNLVSMIEKI
ncbi:MAG: UPF0147 family protein [Nanoarchaeota archaeon]